MSHLGTEFGELLCELVTDVPGGRAAVLSDAQGDAIDFAHDPELMEALDVQLTGAQIGQTLLRMHRRGPRFGFRDPVVLVEAEHSHLVTAAVAGFYVLALVLCRHANLARALQAFSAARTHTETLLR